MIESIRAVLRAIVLVALGSNLAATWSIILIDTRTGEVAIGSATCVQGWDLRSLTAVLVVGKGGACAQSYVDFSGRNRLVIWNGFKNGTDPKDILAELARIDPGHQTRQYGIADTQGRAIGFSGTGAAEWKGDVTGRVGTIVYAIQGNILAGAKVVDDAVAEVLRGTHADLAEKLMAAMEAARKMGGDGRCSCLSGPPTSCGTPPPNFRKSADIGFMMIGRLGDTDGVCNGSAGCATGQYYMNLNVIGASRDPDPVLTLKTRYDAWRSALAGRPDHHLSTLTLPTRSLPADATTGTTARITLRDLEGTRITTGGAQITVALDPASTAALTIGTVQDHGDGTYSIPLRAGSTAGLAKLRITIDDGKGKVQLAPLPELAVTRDRLWVSNETLPRATGGALEFVINQGTAHAGQPYILLASNSGSQPGTFLGPNLLLPLNIDQLFWTVFFASGTSLPGFLGTLDSTGRKTVRLPMPPGLYELPVPSDLSFASTLVYPLDGISNPVRVQLVR